MCCGFDVPTPASLISQGPFCQGFCRRAKGGNKENESTSSSLSRRNQVLRVGKTVVFDGKMGICKFGSAAPPFGKVACAVKVFQIMPLLNLIGYSNINCSRFLIKNLAFLIFSCSKAVKTKLASKRVLSIYRPIIPKFVRLLR